MGYPDEGSRTLMESSTAKEKRFVSSIEFSPEIRKKLDIAVKITGRSLRDIVAEALETHLPLIVNAHDEELERLKREFEEMQAKPDPGKRRKK